MGSNTWNTWTGFLKHRDGVKTKQYFRDEGFGIVLGYFWLEAKFT
jgi:hypothetical protein